MAHGLLAPALGYCSPNGATHCLRYGVWIAPPCARQGFKGFQNGIVDSFVQKAAITIALRNTNEIE